MILIKNLNWARTMTFKQLTRKEEEQFAEKILKMLRDFNVIAESEVSNNINKVDEDSPEYWEDL